MFFKLIFQTASEKLKKMLFVDYFVLRPTFGLDDVNFTVFCADKVAPHVFEALVYSLKIYIPSIHLINATKIAFIKSAYFP